MEVGQRLSCAMALVASCVLIRPLAALAPASGPSFTEAWYREVMLGDLAGAGVEYQRIYDGSGVAPTRSRPDETRRRAALRAGGCFEKLGDQRRAQAAYSWLIWVGPPGDPLVRSAELRLLELGGTAVSPPAPPLPAAPRPEPVPAGESAVIPPAAAPSPAATPPADLLERLRTTIERREACTVDLRAELGRRNAEAREEVRLRRRLLDLGVEVPLEGEPLPPAERTFASLALDPEDREFLRSELADRYYLHGLRALRDRDPAAAVRELRKALSLRPDFLDAPGLLRAAEGFLQPMEGIAERAALRLQERKDGRRIAVQQALRGSLASAERPSAQGRVPSLALEKGRSSAEWASEAVWRDEELRELVRDADTRVLLGAPPAPSLTRGYQELRSRGRRAAEDLLEIAEDLTDARWIATDRRGAEPAAGAGQAEDRRAGAAGPVGMELERILVRGEDLYRKMPQDQSPDTWRREFFDILILARWFPEADPGQRFRKLAQSYLAR